MAPSQPWVMARDGDDILFPAEGPSDDRKKRIRVRIGDACRDAAARRPG